MTGGYARIDPYIVEQEQAGRHFRVLIFHLESKAWFDNETVDSSLADMDRFSLVQQGDTVFDLGCNIGFNAAWYALAVGPRGRVLGFDPFPWNALASRFNAKINRLRNIDVYQLGVGSADEIVDISLTSASTANRSGPLLLKTKIMALQRFAHLRPNIIKIDVEGAEYEISSTDFSRFERLRLCFIEFHPQFIRDRGLDPTKCLDNFQNHGFAMHRHSPDGPLYRSGDQVGAEALWMYRQIAGAQPG